MSKTRNWRTRAISMVGALALVVSMLSMLAAPVAGNGGPVLDISVDPDSGTIFCGDSQNLTVTVSNTGDYAEDVVLTGAVTPGDPATLTATAPADGLLYDICPGCSKEATFNLTCTGPGPVNVTFTATPTNGGEANVQVNYEQMCRFDVEITTPEHETVVAVSDTFAVAANITNNTDEDCGSLDVSLDIDGNAERVGGSDSYTITLPAGATEEVNWTVHCNATGAVNLTVTAEGCGQADSTPGSCAELCADTVKIYQTPPAECDPYCDFEIDILPPEYACDEDICVCDAFNVSVNVTNLCDACGGAISGTVEMHATGYAHEPGHSTTDNIIREPFSGIAPGDSEILTFTWHCYDADDNCNATEPLDLFQSGVSFEARAWATSARCHMPLSGSHGWSNSYASDTYDDYINQTWIDLKLVDGAGDPICTCQDFCVDDNILVYPQIRNCGDKTLQNAEVYFLDMAGNISWEGGEVPSIHIGNIPAGETRTSERGFHFRCTGLGDVSLSFKGTGVYLPVETVCDIDEVTLHQKEPPVLKVKVDVEDCQQYCDNFPVKATITNEGGSDATAIENLDVAMTTTSGDVELVTDKQFLGDDANGNGKLDWNETWEYEWIYHCSGPNDAYFRVDAEGDAACGGDVADYAEASIEQIKLDIDIITPERCDTKCVSETFCVTANIADNDADTCFAGLNATVSFPNGKADIEVGENYTKAFDLTAGDTQQISWSVHCEEAGDTDIKVEVTGTASDSTETTTCDKCNLVNKFDTITIHQIGVPDLDMEITSPASGNTFVATSQDFAVTATIVNNTSLSDVTITDIGLDYSPESGATIVEGPEVPFDIPEDGSTKVTWTMHCDEPGLLDIRAYATAENEIGCVGEAWTTIPVLVWQYPAANLEVEILGVEPGTTVTACQNFTVSYKVRNTGAADATDVVAELSVTPEGSARPVEGIGSGYTQPIGTIPAGGETEVLEWNLHCKTACESTITITAEGNDEYGWHKKQECQTSGTFEINSGEVDKLEWDYDSGYEAVGFIFHGIPTGLTGPFNLEAEVAFDAGSDSVCAEGRLSILGWVDPATGLMEGWGWVKDQTLCGTDTSASWSGWIEVINGYFQAVNGMFQGDFAGYYYINGKTGNGIPITVAITNGTYCSTMAQEALRPIEFIESDTVTVKQVEPAQLVVDISYPEDGDKFNMSNTFPVVATITNIGEETAADVSVNLTVDDNATVTDATQSLGDITGGASEVVTWQAHCDSAGFSVFTATASGTGEISGNALQEAFDTVTVKQGEIPDAQLAVDITYPANGAEFVVGGQFMVTTRITNLGKKTAQNVTADMTISDNAEVVSGPTGTWPKSIGPTSSAIASWTLNCTGAGFSLIVVEASGNNSNTAMESVTVNQIAPPEPYLTVEVNAPAQILVDQSYYVTAVVSNTGNADAAGVSATLAISGDATATEALSQPIGSIAAGSAASVTWTLSADAAGGVNLEVSAQGTDTNVAVDAASVMQLNPFEAVWSGLSVAPTSGDAPLTVNVLAIVSNTGDVAGGCLAELKVDSEVVDDQIVVVAGGATETTGFTYEFTAGTYQVTINDLAPVTVIVGLPCIPGDANDDGVVDVLDLALTARIIAGLEPDGGLHPCADANQDAVVDVLDLAKIARIIAGLE